ncbi:hypothetical protein CBOM_04994 [Ceraceosorus bombacis]|uniref:Uncharacterized protein n=1 Tax=Ceraceosorus bombacis TaxID=401625 RepID=A0A0P1BHH7_9BASI|nr:hypothetical protein CBOM_04994 [Ceraceosorus bombacis]
MSFQQRVTPILLATLVGIVSGAYLFGPPLQQFKVDSREMDKGGANKDSRPTIADQGRAALLDAKDQAKDLKEQVQAKAKAT